jgi:Type II secretion system (T2SS), protein E, N-terminal domain
MEKNERFATELLMILVRKHLVNSQEVPKLIEIFNHSDQDSFEEFLIEEGLIEKNDLLDALAEYYQVPSFDVIGYFFDTALLRKFPKEFLLFNGIIPLEVDESILVIIASNPADPMLPVLIGTHVSYEVEFMIGLRVDINDAVKEFYESSPTHGQEPNLFDAPEDDRLSVRDSDGSELDEDLENDDLDLEYLDSNQDYEQ